MKIKIVCLIILSLFLLSGCGVKVFKSKAKQENAAQQKGDITRPPVLKKRPVEIADEADPNEIISFDEWKNKNSKPKEAQ